MCRISDLLYQHVIKSGICTGCGACVGVDLSGTLTMKSGPYGPRPDITPSSAVSLPKLAWQACPGKGIDYPQLYQDWYGGLPNNWLLGHFQNIRTGFASDPVIRKHGASGGVMTQMLVYLLETKRIDAAIVVRQGCPTPGEASAVIVDTPEKIKDCAQSVYIPVSTLDMLNKLDRSKRYAMTCLPDQAAALRQLQVQGFEPARQIRYLFGPYMGTALYPSAIDCLMRSHGISSEDFITSLQWRAGEWPGHLEIHTSKGKIIRSKKVYYNFLIPFFITQASLQGMDFTNEFCDLSVGDAWSPQFESQGGGHSVVITRSAEMENILIEAMEANIFSLDVIEPVKACDMHGHMLDFKKRGSYLRNRWRNLTGRKFSDYGLHPKNITLTRILAEVFISTIFRLAGTTVSRNIVQRIPEKIIGPFFNTTRLAWKGISKPTKRKGLRNLEMECYQPSWVSKFWGTDQAKYESSTDKR